MNNHRYFLIVTSILHHESLSRNCLGLSCLGLRCIVQGQILTIFLELWAVPFLFMTDDIYVQLFI